MHISDILQIYRNYSSIEVHGVDYHFDISIKNIDHKIGSCNLVISKTGEQDLTEMLEEHILLRYPNYCFQNLANKVYFQIKNEKEFRKLYLGYVCNFDFLLPNPKLAITYS